MKGSGERLDRFIELIKLLSLGEVLSVSSAADKTGAAVSTVSHQLERLHDSGLVYVAGLSKNARGPSFPVYGWASPFGRPDEELTKQGEAE